MFSNDKEKVFKIFCNFKKKIRDFEISPSNDVCSQASVSM